eukprot:COSAG01_NODE_14_length_41020_cov_40.702133_34_plen_315_part_00
MTTYIIFFVIGIASLWVGGDCIVTGASKIAKRFSVPSFIIGLTLLAFGTSAPELVINIIAARKEEANIVFGNILGSNISNLLLILGITGLIWPISTPEKGIKRNAIIALLSVLILLCLIKAENMYLTIVSGSIFLSCFMIYLWIIIKIKTNNKEEDNVEESRLSKEILYFIIGMISLPIGGKLVVESSIFIANILNISSAAISLFALALGTSLPELVTSIQAALKKQSGMAIGNIIGSNIFNIFLVLGISICINPLRFNEILYIDLIWILCGTFAVLSIIFLNSKQKILISKKIACLLLIAYILYVLHLTNRFL